jgi:hypothetical protein
MVLFIAIMIGSDVLSVVKLNNMEERPILAVKDIGGEEGQRNMY